MVRPKEYLLFFDGIIGDFTRLPCFYVFDETTALERTARRSAADRKFGWFSWYLAATSGAADNSAEIEKGWIVKGENASPNLPPSWA